VRTVGVVTVARSDYGIYRPILRRIEAEPALSLRLLVSGAHLCPEFGDTVREIEADGFAVAASVHMLLASDRPEAVSKSMGIGIAGFADAYARERPDILLVLGDRFEMHAAALAALPFKIPVAHVHGGELTEGAIDDALRHSMTKLSHLHFVATDDYRRRVLQLGEEPWRVTVSGAPGLDNLREVALLGRAELASELGLPLDVAPLLVTYHPATLEWEQTAWHVTELLEALRAIDRPIVFTAPNADTGSRAVRGLIETFVASRPAARLVANLGMRRYFSLMAQAAAMVGNSSSGLVEAPSFELPVVNVGSRQAGRTRAENVVDVKPDREAIREGIERALSPAFRVGLRHLVNPYGDGRAAEVIVRGLRDVAIDDRLLVKRFVDLAAGVPRTVPA